MVNYSVTWVHIVGGDETNGPMNVSTETGQASDETEKNSLISADRFTLDPSDKLYRKEEIVDPAPTLPFDNTGWTDITPS